MHRAQYVRCAACRRRCAARAVQPPQCDVRSAQCTGAGHSACVCTAPAAPRTEGTECGLRRARRAVRRVHRVQCTLHPTRTAQPPPPPTGYRTRGTPHCAGCPRVSGVQGAGCPEGVRGWGDHHAEAPAPTHSVGKWDLGAAPPSRPVPPPAPTARRHAPFARHSQACQALPYACYATTCPSTATPTSTPRRRCGRLSLSLFMHLPVRGRVCERPFRWGASGGGGGGGRPKTHWGILLLDKTMLHNALNHPFPPWGRVHEWAPKRGGDCGVFPRLPCVALIASLPCRCRTCAEVCSVAR